MPAASLELPLPAGAPQPRVAPVTHLSGLMERAANAQTRQSKQQEDNGWEQGWDKAAFCACLGSSGGHVCPRWLWLHTSNAPWVHLWVCSSAAVCSPPPLCTQAHRREGAATRAQEEPLHTGTALRPYLHTCLIKKLWLLTAPSLITQHIFF